MSDQNKRQYQKLYAHEFKLAGLILGEQPKWSPHDYEAFFYKKDGVSLVFYPHKTSAHNYHIRVRDNGSKDKAQAAKLMALLDYGAGPCCTFKHKLIDINAAYHAGEQSGKEHGWAERELRK